MRNGKGHKTFPLPKPTFMVTAKTGRFLLEMLSFPPASWAGQKPHPPSPAVRLGTWTQLQLSPGLVPAFQAQSGEPNDPTPRDVFLFFRSPSKSNSGNKQTKFIYLSKIQVILTSLVFLPIFFSNACQLKSINNVPINDS